MVDFDRQVNGTRRAQKLYRAGKVTVAFTENGMGKQVYFVAEDGHTNLAIATSRGGIEAVIEALQQVRQEEFNG